MYRVRSFSHIRLGRSRFRHVVEKKRRTSVNAKDSQGEELTIPICYIDRVDKYKSVQIVWQR